MGFSRQEYWSGEKKEYWSGLPFPPPGDLPDPGIEPASPALAGRFFASESPGKSLEASISVRKSDLKVSDLLVRCAVGRMERR